MREGDPALGACGRRDGTDPWCDVDEEVEFEGPRAAVRWDRPAGLIPVGCIGWSEEHAGHRHAERVVLWTRAAIRLPSGLVAPRDLRGSPIFGAQMPSANRLCSLRGSGAVVRIGVGIGEARRK